MIGCLVLVRTPCGKHRWRTRANSSNQTITLPQGGGALHGIGETFSPDLHTGTGNFTVPIALPPGRNGFQPQLNLVYSTGNGNGPFGLGWSLSIPGVSRKTSRGIPRYAGRARYLLAFRRGGSGACRGDGGSDALSATNRRALRSHRTSPRCGHRSLGGSQQGRAGQRVRNTAQHPERSGGHRQSGESKSDLQLETHRRPKTPSGIPSATTMNGTWATPPTICGTSSTSSGYGTQTTPIAPSRRREIPGLGDVQL